MKEKFIQNAHFDNSAARYWKRGTDGVCAGPILDSDRWEHSRQKHDWSTPT